MDSVLEGLPGSRKTTLSIREQPLLWRESSCVQKNFRWRGKKKQTPWSSRGMEIPKGETSVSVPCACMYVCTVYVLFVCMYVLCMHCMYAWHMYVCMYVCMHACERACVSVCVSEGKSDQKVALLYLALRCIRLCYILRRPQLQRVWSVRNRSVLFQCNSNRLKFSTIGISQHSAVHVFYAVSWSTTWLDLPRSISDWLHVVYAVTWLTKWRWNCDMTDYVWFTLCYRYCGGTHRD